MMIRPLVEAYGMGTATGAVKRPAEKKTSLHSSGKDTLLLGSKSGINAGLYSPGQIFKMTGSVELMSPDTDKTDTRRDFGANSFLL